MDQRVRAYLADKQPVGESDTVWANGRVRLHLTSFFTDDLPPEPQIGSVRCIVFHGDDVLVIRHEREAHVLPGGRREPGETLRETIDRELLEEVGWTVDETQMVGVVWLHSHSPRWEGLPADSPRHPDFFWIIYTAEAIEEQREGLHADYPEGVPTWVPITEAESLPMGVENRLFLRRALTLRRQQTRPPAQNNG